MTQTLVEIFKKNSKELEELKKEISEMKKTLEKIENETNYYCGEIKEISQKSFYIEKYLENLQNKEIEEILNDEELN